MRQALSPKEVPDSSPTAKSVPKPKTSKPKAKLNTALKPQSLKEDDSVGVRATTQYYISSWVKNTNSFRNLLNTSKGRDKCA